MIPAIICARPPEKIPIAEITEPLLKRPALSKFRRTVVIPNARSPCKAAFAVVSRIRIGFPVEFSGIIFFKHTIVITTNHTPRSAITFNLVFADVGSCSTYDRHVLISAGNVSV
ncbi:MAG: hypothetical protein WCF90_06395 [Methanomicrobiales archaeon]